tara:strand:+ start:1423 stop:2328 length:906 start_codon:yes stop_codon:yes gene_type:complete
MCEFPYYTNNNTCILYSKYDQKTYETIKIVFTLLNTIGIILSLLICIYTYIENNWIFRVKQKLILGIFVSFLLLFFQFLDPFGYNGWMPYIGDILLSNLSAWISLSILYIMLFFFTKVYQRFKYSSIDSIPFLVSFILTLIITLVCSFLQVFNNRFIWRGVKLLFLATYITILTTHINVYFYKMINLFNTDYDKKRRTKIILIILNIIMPIIVLLQYYLGINILMNHTESSPEIDWKLIILPSSHILSNFIGLIYFRGKVKIPIKDMLIYIYNNIIYYFNKFCKKKREVIIELTEFNSENI